MATIFKNGSQGEGQVLSFIWDGVAPVTSGGATGSNQYVLVKLEGGAGKDNYVVPCTAKTDIPIGVTQTNPLKALVPVEVMVSGISWVQNGSAVAINPGTQLIGTTSSGTTPNGSVIAAGAWSGVPSAAAYIGGDSVSGEYAGVRGNLFAMIIRPRFWMSA